MRPQDENDRFKLFCDAEVGEWITRPPAVNDLDASNGRLQRDIDDHRSSTVNKYRIAIALKADDRVVGMIALDHSYTRLDLALGIGERDRHNGYATEAALALFERVFERNPEIDFIYGRVEDANGASREFVEGKLKMKRVETLYSVARGVRYLQ
jgi:RimJ/RimL family protein N-acetyltransferase